MAIRGVLFDFDGTLTKPGSLDFHQIREAVGCPQGTPILEFIETLPEEAMRTRAHHILNDFEMEAAARSRANGGAEELVLSLRSGRVRLGILSRNSLAAIRRALENFARLTPADFDVLLSRDDAFLPKPSPDAVLAAAGRMGILPHELMVVGDFVFDIEAGHRAGARTAFLTNRDPTARTSTAPDHVIHRLEELRDILPLYEALEPGKLPNRLLRAFLEELRTQDSSLLIAPGMGEDVAALDITGEEVLVLKSDPITFTSDSIARYAVAVNVNDVATAGARPRWLVASLLFPPGTSAASIRTVMQELADACRESGLTLCGGHTEITGAVTRPVISAHVSGTVAAGRLIDKRSMKPGDRILMTKRLAVEGTSIIARELRQLLISSGFLESEIERCRGFLERPGISILAEARIAAETGGVTAMHDVTEGGLATALEELSVAGGHRIRVYRDRIPVFEETARICRHLEIDPLGLIGSGSLLIACGASAEGTIHAALQAAGIESCTVGEVLEAGEGVDARNPEGEPVPWPHFEVDELPRLFGRIDAPGTK